MPKQPTNLIAFPLKPGINFAPTTTTQSVVKLATGRAGTLQTLAAMRKFVDEYKVAPQVRELSLRLVNNHAQKDYLAEIKSLYLYVKERIRYTRDVYGVETVQTPLKTLEYKAGDCDDKSTLLAAMLESIGFETRFHAMGRGAGAICHVIVEVLNPLTGMWIPLETTQDVSIGWLPPDIGKRIYYYKDGRAQALDGFISDTFKKVTNIHKKGIDLAKSSAKSRIKATKQAAGGDVKGSMSTAWKGAKDDASDINQLRKDINLATKPKFLVDAEGRLTDASVKALSSKAGSIVLTILSVIPVTSVFALAAQGALVVAQAENIRKSMSKMDTKNRKATTQALAVARYVYDPKISAIRERQPTGDEGLVEFKYIDGQLIKLTDEEKLNVQAELTPAQKKQLINNTIAATATQYPEYAASLKKQLEAANLPATNKAMATTLGDLGLGWGEAFGQIATQVAGQYASGKIAAKFANDQMKQQIKLMNKQLQAQPQTPPVQGQRKALDSLESQISAFTDGNNTAIVVVGSILAFGLLYYFMRGGKR